MDPEQADIPVNNFTEIRKEQTVAPPEPAKIPAAEPVPVVPEPVDPGTTTKVETTTITTTKIIESPAGVEVTVGGPPGVDVTAGGPPGIAVVVGGALETKASTRNRIDDTLEKSFNVFE